MKKKYIIFFIVFVVVDILWVIIPNIKSIHSYQLSRMEMEHQLSKYDLSAEKGKQDDRDIEYWLFQLDEIMKKEGIVILNRNFSMTQNESIQLSLELQCSKIQLQKLLESSEWNNGKYKILSINSSLEDSQYLNTIIEILIKNKG
ncbi:hypothetical protein [Filifactor alocis]